MLLSDNIGYKFLPTDSYKALKRFYNHWDTKTEFFFELGIWLIGVSEVKKYTTSINLLANDLREMMGQKVVRYIFFRKT